MVRGSGFGRGKVVTAIASLTLLAGADAPPPTRYIGLCEASAAAMLDATHFVVASDDSDNLLVYERGKPDGTVAMALRGSLADVTDIEGAARIGDTIFWLTSHSVSRKKKEDQPERKRLFATGISGLTLEPIGTQPSDFRRTVLDALELKDDVIGTFNMEGLAATADGALLVGLRAPLGPRGGAYVARIDQPLALVGLGSVARGSTAKRFVLPLGGRGIRSMERVGNAFLIVAGPSGESSDPAPALFWWDGKSETVTPGPAVPGLERITPEAMIVWDGNHVQILGDNEKNCSDKKPGPKWFPSVDLRF